MSEMSHSFEKFTEKGNAARDEQAFAQVEKWMALITEICRERETPPQTTNYDLLGPATG